MGYGQAADDPEQDRRSPRPPPSYFAGFGKEQHLQDLVQRFNGHSLMLGKIAARVEEYYEDGTTTLDAVEAILTEMTRLQTQENDLLEVAGV